MAEITLTNQEQEKSDLEVYRKAVEELAKKLENWTFRNSSEKHANIVISNIFRCSRKTIQIYDQFLRGDLVEDGSDYFKESLQTFLSSSTDSCVQIVISEEIDRKSNLYNILVNSQAQYTTKKIDMRSISKPFRDAMNDLFVSECIFIIGDSRSYRIEEVKDKSTNKRRNAICNFNSQNDITSIVTTFNNYFETCKEVDA